MRDKGLGVTIALGVILFSLMWLAVRADLFGSSAPVVAGVAVVQGSAPTVDDDIDRGYLPGSVWVHEGTAVYIALSTGDGAADWNQID